MIGLFIGVVFLVCLVALPLLLVGLVLRILFGLLLLPIRLVGALLGIVFGAVGALVGLVVAAIVILAGIVTVGVVLLLPLLPLLLFGLLAYFLIRMVRNRTQLRPSV